MRQWQFWTLNGVAGMVLLLIAVNISLFLDNRELQGQTLERQQFINQSIRLSRVNTQLIRAIAGVSAQTNDAQLRDLLAAHGVTFNLNPDATESSE